jgi:hypothetical protein
LVALADIDLILNQLVLRKAISPFAPEVSDFLVSGISIAAFAIQIILMFMLYRMITKLPLHGRWVNRISLVFGGAHLAIISLFAFTILQILLFSYYHTVVPALGEQLAYFCAIFLAGLLAARMLTWFRSSGEITMLLYGLFAVFLAMYMVTRTFVRTQLLLDLVPVMDPQTFPFISREGVPNFAQFLNIQTALEILGFLSIWSATILLLLHYKQKLGKGVVISVCALPAVPPAIAFVILTLIYATNAVEANEAFMKLATLPYLLQSLASGIILGLPFLLIGLKLKGNALIVKKYLLIAFVGMVLFHVANYSALELTIFPPFGFASVSSLSLSAYTLFLGLYLSVAVIAGDVNLRASIRKILAEDPKILNRLAEAEVQEQLHHRVKKLLVAAEALEPQREIDKSSIDSLSEEQVRDYISDVMEEIHGLHKKKLE